MSIFVYMFVCTLGAFLIMYLSYVPRKKRTYAWDSLNSLGIGVFVCWMVLSVLYAIDDSITLFALIPPLLFGFAAYELRKAFDKAEQSDTGDSVDIEKIYEEMCEHVKKHPVWNASVRMIAGLMKRLPALEQEIGDVRSRRERIQAVQEKFLNGKEKLAHDTSEIKRVEQAVCELNNREQRLTQLVLSVQLKITAMYAAMLSTFTDDEALQIQEEIAALLSSVETEVGVVERTHSSVEIAHRVGEKPDMKLIGGDKSRSAHRLGN